jgi:hypothetical protein
MRANMSADARIAPQMRPDAIPAIARLESFVVCGGSVGRSCEFVAELLEVLVLLVLLVLDVEDVIDDDVDIEDVVEDFEDELLVVDEILLGLDVVDVGSIDVRIVVINVMELIIVWETLAVGVTEGMSLAVVSGTGNT